MAEIPRPSGSGPDHRESDPGDRDDASAHQKENPAGFGLVVVGAAGLVHHFVPGFALFAFVARIPVVSRYDLYVSATLLVLGVALLIGGDRVRRPRRR